MQVRRWWTRFPKMLVVVGLLAAAYSMYGGGARRASLGISAQEAPFYPGPCSTAPSNVSITFRGPLSGCTQNNGKACSAQEAIEFTAVSTSYSFATCDKFAWTFGDGITMTTLLNGTSHQFAAGVPRTVTLTVTNDFGSTSASAQDVSPVTATSCTPSTTQACLNGGRYAVTLDALTRDQKKQATGLVTKQTDLFGYFSLPAFTSQPENPEVFIKVIGPIGTPPVPWVFYSGLTDVEYFINVLDTQTGQLRQYHVPPAANPTQSKGDFDVAGNFSQACNTVTRTTSTIAPGTCTPDANTLCLFSNRFKLTVVGKDDPARTGKSAVGVATPVSGKPFGFFSFPALTNDPTNLEVFVKMLDARTFDGHIWVFFGGLTDFEFTLTVTDTTTGKTQTYLKPLKSTCGLNDTTGFP